MSNVVGDENGIAVLQKLAKSNIVVVKQYYERLMSNAVVPNATKKLYFSDFEEQLNKKLNNQTTYTLAYNFNKEVWNVEHFLTPK